MDSTLAGEPTVRTMRLVATTCDSDGEWPGSGSRMISAFESPELQNPENPSGLTTVNVWAQYEFGEEEAERSARRISLSGPPYISPADVEPAVPTVPARNTCR